MLEIPKGFHIEKAAQFAINEAQHRKESIKFEFNQLEIVASPSSCVSDICEIYNLKSELRRFRINKDSI